MPPPPPPPVTVKFAVQPPAGATHAVRAVLLQPRLSERPEPVGSSIGSSDADGEADGDAEPVGSSDADGEADGDAELDDEEVEDPEPASLGDGDAVALSGLAGAVRRSSVARTSSRRTRLAPRRRAALAGVTVRRAAIMRAHPRLAERDEMRRAPISGVL